MATMTAQILVGKAHPNHGGLQPSHILSLGVVERGTLAGKE